MRTIVAQELAAFLAARRSQSVTPTVVALRTHGDRRRRRPSSPASTAGCPTSTSRPAPRSSRAVNRVADKLLHQPTVRVKELANESGAISYAAALAELFALDPEAVEAVTRAEVERP